MTPTTSDRGDPDLLLEDRSMENDDISTSSYQFPQNPFFVGSPPSQNTAPEDSEELDISTFLVFGDPPEDEMLPHGKSALENDRVRTKSACLENALVEDQTLDVSPSTLKSAVHKAVWKPYSFEDCSSCQLVRQIIHANENCITKLFFHLSPDVPLHAIKVVQTITHEIEEKGYTAGLRSMDPESLQGFLLSYGQTNGECGLNLVHDRHSPFLDVMAVKMDYLEDHIGKPTELQTSVLQPNISGCVHMNNADLGLLGNLQLFTSSWGTPVIYGNKRAEGGAQKNKNYRHRFCRPDIKIQRLRTVRMAYEDISTYFDLPLAEACEKLMICTTAMKKVCRRHNIDRWPYRRIMKEKKKHRKSGALQNRNKKTALRTAQCTLLQGKKAENSNGEEDEIKDEY